MHLLKRCQCDFYKSSSVHQGKTQVFRFDARLLGGPDVCGRVQNSHLRCSCLGWRHIQSEGGTVISQVNILLIAQGDLV